MTTEEHLIEISINLVNMQTTLLEIKAENLRIWTRLDEHSTEIAKMKGWIAGIAITCSIFIVFIGIIKLFP